MELTEQVQRLSVALAIGLIIGLERGWQTRETREGERTAGLRTHALLAVLGGIWGAIAKSFDQGGALALAAAFLAASGAIVLFRYRETEHDGTFGATTIIGAMLAFSLGAFAMIGDMQVAAATGVAVAGLLASKAAMHAFVQRITWPELRSALLLLAMTFILLPILPRRPVDPWQAINPFELWLMTIMIAAISYAGYIAMKVEGERVGPLMTGIAGGLVSSTAVTVTMARIAREHPEQMQAFLAGALAAGAMMMLRVLVIVGVVNAPLLNQLLLPLGLAGLTFAAAVMVLLGSRRAAGDQSRSGLVLKNPFDLPTVLKFGTLLTALSVLAKVATGAGGKWGAFAIAGLSGLADVDAIVLSMSRLGADSLGGGIASQAILIVIAVNTATKAVVAWVSGGASVGRIMGLASAAAIGAGALGYLLEMA